MTEYKQLAEQAVEMRKRAEFAPATWENLGSKIASMFTECVELEKALEQHQKVMNQNLELADITLYVLSALGDLGEDWTLRNPRFGELSRFGSPETLTKNIRHSIGQVFEFWRRDKRKDTVIALELVLKRCIELADALEIDLPYAVRHKIGLNNLRPICHGGKNPNT